MFTHNGMRRLQCVSLPALAGAPGGKVNLSAAPTRRSLLAVKATRKKVAVRPIITTHK